MTLSPTMYSKHILTAFLLLAVTGTFISAAEPKFVLSDIGHAVKAIKSERADVTAAKREELKRSINKTNDDLAILTKRFADKSVPAAYVQDLQSIKTALETAGKKSQLTADDVGMLAFVAEDINVKRRQAESHEGAAATNVKVMATTRKGAEIEKGLAVLYRRVIDKDAAAVQFQTFSSPAEATMPPGLYVIWARRSGTPHADGSKQTYKIVGESPLKIDVASP